MTQCGVTGYVLSGNVDQKHGGVSIYMDGGASFHVKDHTENWEIISNDVETIGCDPTEESPVHRAQIHSWSIAYFPTVITCGLRGQPLANRVFFYGPPVGLAKEMLEDPGIGKVNHQCHYDTHSFHNAGIETWPSLDTLRLSRLLNPHLKAHGLKHLMLEMLGYQMGEFTTIFSKPTFSTVTGKELKKRARLELTEVVPFTEKFCQLADYASLDSKATAEACVLLVRQIAARKTYKLPEYMDEYYADEPRWLTVLRRIAGTPRTNPD